MTEIEIINRDIARLKRAINILERVRWELQKDEGMEQELLDEFEHIIEDVYFGS